MSVTAVRTINRRARASSRVESCWRDIDWWRDSWGLPIHSLAARAGAVCIKKLNSVTLLHLLTFLGYSEAQETTMTRTTSQDRLSAGLVTVVGLIIIGVGVAGPA